MRGKEGPRPAEGTARRRTCRRTRSRALLRCTLAMGLLVIAGCRSEPAPAVPLAPIERVQLSVATPAAAPTMPADAADVARSAQTVAPTRTPGTGTSPAPSRTVTPDLAALLRANPMPVRDAALGDVDRSRGAAPALPQVGDRKAFWVLDLAAAGHVPITATMLAAGDHIQLWVEDGVPVDVAALEETARVFDERIYPTLRAAFGSERSPGIDGDPRLVALHARISGVAGYFAANNGLPRSVDPYSNEHEMFVLNLNALQPASEPYLRVLAHEFQHMIHWHNNPGEAAWVNEGASLLAEDLAGFGPPVGDVRAYAHRPDIQLTTWSMRGDRLSAHYGAAYLFLRYFYERYGAEALRTLVAHPRPDVAGFDEVLLSLGALGFDALFADWAVANLVNDLTLEDGRYGYAELDVAVEPQTLVHRYPHSVTDAVAPYGVQYLMLYPDLGASETGTLQIQFEGAQTTRLVPTDAPSGRYVWWSNRGDLGHSYLERTFDLRSIRQAELTFDLWFDMEYGWDYAGVRVSLDGGQTWNWLEGRHTTVLPGANAAPGPVYSGRSGVSRSALYGPAPPAARWVRESLDLTPYGGHEIVLRVDKFTDDAVNGPGLCLDNIAIAAIGFYDDGEIGEGAWAPHGFLRHDNVLPVSWVVQAVAFGEELQVRPLPLEGGRGEWTLDGLGSRWDRVALVVTALAPVTTEPIPYRLQIERQR